jgi:hypothetical protein
VLRPIQLFAFLALLFRSAPAQTELHYPFFPTPHLKIQLLGNLAQLSAEETNVNVTYLRSDSLNGPWVNDGDLISVDQPRAFIRAVINPNFVRFEGTLVSATYIALRTPTVGDASITTKSGFRLRIYQTNWIDGINICHVDDGPATGDLAADYAKLFDDLWKDERTDFVAPVSMDLVFAQYPCFLGYGDQLIVSGGHTDEELATFDLRRLKDYESFSVAQWMKPKSMRLSDFLNLLEQSGITASVNALGCAD